jgi:hypothetical protein
MSVKANRRRTETALNAEHAENAENGVNQGKGERERREPFVLKGLAAL